MNRLPTSSLLLTCLLASPPVLADEAPGAALAVRSTVVRYGDLDLESDADVRALYLRLQAAAERVCGQADGRDLRAVADLRRCRQDALAAAVDELPSTRLAALHTGQDRQRIAVAGR
jgi:UrcA family protein